MKIIQKPNQMEIHLSGFNSIFFGAIMVIVGLVSIASGVNKLEPFLTVLFGGVSTFIGIMLISYAKKKIIILEKKDTIFIEKYVIFGQSRQHSMPTSNIVAVIFSTSINQDRDSNGNALTKRSCTLSLLLKNNDLIKLQNSGGSLSVNGMDLSSLLEQSSRKKANQIAAFLKIPLQDSTNPEFQNSAR